MVNYKVSVIVPVYNAESYLQRCIDSILNQTYTEFEIILINDGSKDNSGKICDEYAQKDTRIKVIHQKNSGVSKSRNVGLQAASGDYILFVDSDDYISPDMIEKLVQKAVVNKSDIVMCNYCIDKGDDIFPVFMKYNGAYISSQQVKDGLLYLYYTDNHIGLYSLCNKLFKKSIYSLNDICFDVSLKRGEDAWFVFQCLKYCDRVDYISDILYFYYQNDNSIMHTLYDDQYEHWVNNRKRLLKENEKLGFEIDNNKFYKDFIYKVLLFCRNKVKLNQNEIVKEIFCDEFFLNALKYDSLLPVHIRLINLLIKFRLYKIAILIFKIW